MGAVGLTGAGAGAGGRAIVCGGGGGVLQPVSHKATRHAVQVNCEHFRKWAMA